MTAFSVQPPYSSFGLHSPARRLRLAAMVAVFFAGALCSAFFGLGPTHNQLDYPIQVISTQRVLHGERPFADFQALYGPLGHYVSALFEWPLRSLPPAIAANSFYLLCSVAFLAIAIYLANRIPEDRPRFFYGVLALIFCSTPVISSTSFYSLPALMPSFIALLLIPVAFGETNASRRYQLLAQIAVGMMVAASVFTRINFGIYLGFAIFLTGAAGLVFGKRQIAMSALRCLLFAIVFAGVLLAIFAAIGVAGPEIADMRHYMPRTLVSRSVPLSANPDLKLFGLFILACLPALLRIPGFLRRREIDGRFVGYLLLCAFLSYSHYRFDLLHAFPGIVLSLILVSDVRPMDRSGRLKPAGDLQPQDFKKSPPLSLSGIQLVAAWLLIVTVTSIRGREWFHSARLFWFNHRHHVARISDGIWLDPVDLDVVTHLDAMRKPGEELYLGSEQGSCQSTYDLCQNLTLYLAERTLPQQKIWIFDTASTPFEDVQQEILKGLEEKETPWIVLLARLRRNGGVIAYPEAAILTQYVRQHYQVEYAVQSWHSNARYTIYRRKGRTAR